MLQDCGLKPACKGRLPEVSIGCVNTGGSHTHQPVAGRDRRRCAEEVAEVVVEAAHEVVMACPCGSEDELLDVKKNPVHYVKSRVRARSGTLASRR